MIPNFPDSKTLTLQQEALRRVREMQQRAMRSVEESGAAQQAEERLSSDKAQRQNSSQQKYNTAGSADNFGYNSIFPRFSALGQGNGAQNNRQRQSSPPKGISDLFKRQFAGENISGLGETLQNTVSSVSQPIADLLESFGIDGEKLIILMVMWAVFNDKKEDKTLLLALGYLLL